MPVVTLYYKRLQSMIGRKKTAKEILEMIPYVGLDVEEQANDHIKVEYNPNRPDFSTDYGISRALRGMFGIETGSPKFRSVKSDVSVKVHPSVNSVRPYIVCLVAKNGRLDDEGIRQIIVMQEDIHEGLGRKRKKVSIGIHNYNAIKTPLLYTTEGANFKFVPLNSEKAMTVQEILENTDTGRQYAWILDEKKSYPIIKDGKRDVLSFPPIINSELTRVTEKTKNLFIDVTASDLRAAEDALALIAVTLYDAKFSIQTVKIDYGKKRMETPNMKDTIRNLKPDYVNRLLGMDITAKEMARCLSRTRIGASKSGSRIKCSVPRYRIDVMHDVDLVEDVAVGYGIHRMKATYPQSVSVGGKDSFMSVVDSLREVLVGLGMIEVMNFNLVSRAIQYNMMGGKEASVIAVEQTKSIEHEVLRDSLVPSLMLTLSKNIHEPYPQRIFEVGTIFTNDKSNVMEFWNVAAAIAHKEANYTEAKSYLQATLNSSLNIQPHTRAATNTMLVDGRAAEVIVNGKKAGIVGEVSQSIIDNFKLRVPVSLFEINISKVLNV